MRPSVEKKSQSYVKIKKNSRKKLNNKFKYLTKELTNKKYRFATNMTAWAESFTHAATWQLKSELAFWKAKAKSLEYENSVLHGVIRKNCMQLKDDMVREVNESEGEDEQNEQEPYEDACADDEDDDELEEVHKIEDNDELELSEEFVNFLRENARFREDARRERELLRAKENIEEQNEAETAGPPKDKPEELKELYGDNWMKIAAMESYVQANFINENDIYQPQYWPNIPFNFNFS